MQGSLSHIEFGGHPVYRGNDAKQSIVCNCKSRHETCKEENERETLITLDWTTSCIVSIEHEKEEATTGKNGICAHTNSPTFLDNIVQ